MNWRRVRERDLPALMKFLLPLEERCISFTSRLRFSDKFALPSRREAIVLAAVDNCEGGFSDDRPIREGDISAAVLMTSRGMLLPVHRPGLVLSPTDIRDFLKIFYRYSRSLYCIIGISAVVRQYEKEVKEPTDARILYHLMSRPDRLPLPPNIFTDRLRIRSITENAIEEVFPLEVQYQYEEVLVHPERFSSAAHLIYFRKMVKEQYLLYASLDGAAVAKAGTNAVGFRYSQIGGVYTSPPYRGRRIARSLMIRLLEDIYSRRQGAVLFVRKTNAPAVHLYRKLGFREIDEFQITYLKFD